MHLWNRLSWSCPILGSGSVEASRTPASDEDPLTSMRMSRQSAECRSRYTQNTRSPAKPQIGEHPAAARSAEGAASGRPRRGQLSDARPAGHAARAANRKGLLALAGDPRQRALTPRWPIPAGRFRAVVLVNARPGASGSLRGPSPARPGEGASPLCRQPPERSRTTSARSVPSALVDCQVRPTRRPPVSASAGGHRQGMRRPAVRRDHRDHPASARLALAQGRLASSGRAPVRIAGHHHHDQLLTARPAGRCRGSGPSAGVDAALGACATLTTLRDIQSADSRLSSAPDGRIWHG